MRLLELDPRWFTFSNPADGVCVYIGLTFLCPHCHKQRLGVRFNPPIDLGVKIPGWSFLWPTTDGPVWTRTGETFDTLTLSPSIDASGSRIDFEGHWHGFITNGQIL